MKKIIVNKINMCYVNKHTFIWSLKMIERLLLIFFSFSFLFIGCENPSSSNGSDESESSGSSNFRLIKETAYESNGQIMYYDTYHYNSDGKLIRENGYDPSGTLGEYITYEYDSNGNQIKISYYEDDNEDGVIECYSYDIFECNSNGKETKKTEYDLQEDGSYSCSGNHITEYTYDYNSEGDKHKSYNYNGDGGQYSTIEYIYNSNGLLERLDFYRPSTGELFAKHTYTYNDQGSKTEERNYYEGDLLGTTYFDWNSDGKIACRTIYSYNPDYTYKETFSYDSNGNNVRIDSISSYGNDYIIYEYEALD